MMKNFDFGKRVYIWLYIILYLINGKPEIYIIYIYIYRTKVKKRRRTKYTVLFL